MLDPVLGTELVRVSNAGMDLKEAFAFAREQGARRLRIAVIAAGNRRPAELNVAFRALRQFAARAVHDA